MSTEPSETQAVNAIVDQLYEMRHNDILNDDKSRKATLSLAKRLVSVLDDPLNIATDMMYSPCAASAVKVAVDLNLYQLIDRHSEGPITTTELSERSGGHVLLISRILRLLASIGFVKQVDGGKWTATAITKAMTAPPVMAGYRFLWETVNASAMKSPQYFHEVNYICPTDPTDGIAQYALQTKYQFFEYLAKGRPERLNDFNIFMEGSTGARRGWIDWFPVEEKVINGWKHDTALLVDVAGGKGHDLQAFRSKYPEAQGSLILQDLPNVLDSIQPQSLDESIQRQPQDFFAPNQTKGARAYFMRHIMHDWSDEYALKILSHLRDAMTPDYSMLLIHDFILPDTNASMFSAVFDMAMMIFNGGLERDRSQWTQLLERAGFEVVGFWVDKEQEDAGGIVEAVVRT